MNQKQFAALLGFAFVATWIALNFGYALLALLGAVVFYGAAAVAEGELDLGEMQERLRQPSSRGPVPPNPPRRRRVS